MRHIISTLLFCFSFCIAMEPSQQEKRKEVQKTVALHHIKNNEIEKALKILPFEKLLLILTKEEKEEVTEFYLKNLELSIQVTKIDELISAFPKSELQQMPLLNAKLCHHLLKEKKHRGKDKHFFEAFVDSYVANMKSSCDSARIARGGQTEQFTSDIMLVFKSINSLRLILGIQTCDLEDIASFWQSTLVTAIIRSKQKEILILLNLMNSLVEMTSNEDQLYVAKICLKKIEAKKEIPSFFKKIYRTKYYRYKNGLCSDEKKQQKRDEKIKEIISTIKEKEINKAKSKNYLFAYFECLFEYVTTSVEITPLNKKHISTFKRLIHQTTHPLLAVQATIDYVLALVKEHPDFSKKPKIKKEIHECLKKLQNIKNNDFKCKAAGIHAWVLAKEYEQIEELLRESLLDKDITKKIKNTCKQSLDFTNIGNVEKIQFPNDGKADLEITDPKIISLVMQLLQHKKKICNLLDTFKNVKDQPHPVFIRTFLWRICQAYFIIGLDNEATKLLNQTDLDYIYSFYIAEAKRHAYTIIEQAHEFTQKAIENAPNVEHRASALLLASSLCLSMGKPQEARQCNKEIFELMKHTSFSDEKRNNLLFETHYRNGMSFFSESIPIALKCFEDALSLKHTPLMGAHVLRQYVPALCMIRNFQHAEEKLIALKKRCKKNRKKNPKETKVAEEMIQPAQWLVWGCIKQNKKEAKKLLQKAAQQEKNYFLQHLARVYRVTNLLVEASELEKESKDKNSLQLQNKSLRMLQDLVEEKNHNAWVKAQAQSMYALLYLRLKHDVTEITDETLDIIKKSKVFNHLVGADAQTVNPTAKADVQPILIALAQTPDEWIQRVSWTAEQDDNIQKKLWALDQLGQGYLRMGNADPAYQYFNQLATQDVDQEWKESAQSWIKKYKALFQ